MGHVMKRSRRKFLRLAAGAAALPALPHVALALDYPTRPVHWILSAAPGGAADILARLMGAWLSERLGAQFIVESHPGAGGNIGTETVVQAAPDGYTLHLTATSDAINATLYENLNFNLDRDLAPVAGLIRGPLVMAVTPSFPAKTVPEFIAYAKANPGVINFGSGGVGFATHVAGELFKMLAGVNMVHVPYRGQGPAMTGLLGSQVQVLFDPVVYIASAYSRRPATCLWLCPRRRARMYCQMCRRWVILCQATRQVCGLAPMRRGIRRPSSSIKLNQETNAGLADPALRTRLIDMGGIPMLDELQPTLVSSSLTKLISGRR